MSAAVFADTFYFLALLNTADEAHGRAVEESCIPGRKFVTTEFVLLELADALCRPDDRPGLRTVWAAVARGKNFRVIPASSELLREGLTLYQARNDKEWSLTDCISFAVMQEEKLREALTGDRHFEQEGFTLLLAKR